jgi:hypothetical protein
MKINVMIKKLMKKRKIIIHFKFRFRLIFYIDHNINFNEMCHNMSRDVIIYNIEKSLDILTFIQLN